MYQFYVGPCLLFKAMSSNQRPKDPPILFKALCKTVEGDSSFYIFKATRIFSKQNLKEQLLTNYGSTVQTLTLHLVNVKLPLCLGSTCNNEGIQGKQRQISTHF